MIRKRNIVTSVILSIITCGIYGIYWMAVLNDDVNRLCFRNEDPSGGVVVLLTIITCGIYGYYWYYQMGEKLDCYAEACGEKRQSRGFLYLLLSIIGFGIVSNALMQDSLNKLY